jgi:ribonuclease D
MFRLAFALSSSCAAVQSVRRCAPLHFRALHSIGARLNADLQVGSQSSSLASLIQTDEVSPSAPSSSLPPPAASFPAVSTGFGPRRVVASRVPVSKRAQKAVITQAAVTATSAAEGVNTAATSTPTSTPSSPTTESDVDAASTKQAVSFFSQHRATSAASSHSTAAVSSPAAAATPPGGKAKLTPTELSRAYPGARNLSSNQPPAVISQNPYVHTGWFIDPHSSRHTETTSAPQELPECYITSPSELAQLQLHLARTAVVALDTEFVSSNLYRPSLQLLQLATPSVLAAIDVQLLREHGFHGIAALRELVSTLIKKEWIVHAHRGDLSIMYNLAAELGFAPEKRLPKALFDTQVALSFVTSSSSMSLAAMLSSLVGVHVGKTESSSDWSARPLSLEQIAYGLEDVQFLFACRDLLTDAMTHSTATRSALDTIVEQRLSPASMQSAAPDHGTGVRLQWFQEEMRLLLNPLLYEPIDPEDAYLSSFRSLKKVAPRSRELALFQVLTSWRERLASAQNESPHRLLHEEMLLRVALAQPPVTDVERLAPLLGAAKRFFTAKYGKALVEVVQGTLDQLEKADGSITLHNPLGVIGAESSTSAVDSSESSAWTVVSHSILATTTAAASSALSSSYPFPRLLSNHHSSGRLQPDLLHLLQAVTETRSLSAQIAPAVLAPRRDLVDLASISLESIQTAAKWNSEKIATADSAASCSAAEPSAFAPSPLPSSLNFRFANLEEEVVAERMLDAQGAERTRPQQNVQQAPTATSTSASSQPSDATAGAVEEDSPESNLESAEEVAASAAVEAAPMEPELGDAPHIESTAVHLAVPPINPASEDPEESLSLSRMDELTSEASLQTTVY